MIVDAIIVLPIPSLPVQTKMLRFGLSNHERYSSEDSTDNQVPGNRCLI